MGFTFRRTSMESSSVLAATAARLTHRLTRRLTLAGTAQTSVCIYKAPLQIVLITFVSVLAPGTLVSGAGTLARRLSGVAWSAS